MYLSDTSCKVMAKYNMQKKNLFDMDCVLAPSTKKVMQALVKSAPIQADDFLAFAMAHGASTQDEAAQAEAELLHYGYIAFSSQYGNAHQIEISKWPLMRLYAHHDAVDDLESYEMSSILNLSDAVDYLKKTRQLPKGETVSRMNLYIFMDSVISALQEDEKIKSIIVGFLKDVYVDTPDEYDEDEDMQIRVASNNSCWGALIHTDKRVFLFKDCEAIEKAEKNLFIAEVFDKGITHTNMNAGEDSVEVRFDSDDGAYMQLIMDLEVEAYEFLHRRLNETV